MRAQASSGDEHMRKQYWDRVQEIAWEQEAVHLLGGQRPLVAISSSVKNAHPSALHPQDFLERRASLRWSLMLISG